MTFIPDTQRKTKCFELESIRTIMKCPCTFRGCINKHVGFTIHVCGKWKHKS